MTTYLYMKPYPCTTDSDCELVNFWWDWWLS